MTNSPQQQSCLGSSCPSLVFLTLHSNVSFLLSLTPCGATTSMYMTTETAHSLKWFGLKKKEASKIQASFVPLCNPLCDPACRFQQQHNRRHSQPQHRGQKPLPIFAARQTAALNCTLGVLGPQKEVLLCFSLDQGLILPMQAESRKLSVLKEI